MRIQGVASEPQRNVNVFSKTEENNVRVLAKNLTFFPFLASCFCLQRTKGGDMRQKKKMAKICVRK